MFYSLKLDLIEFQFSDFFRVRVLAIFKDQFFSGSGLGKTAKTRQGFDFGQTQSSFNEKSTKNSIKLTISTELQCHMEN